MTGLNLPHKLEVQHLAIKYNTSDKPVFENVSFSLQSGDILHLAGKNGSGKTTLLYALCNVIPLEIEAVKTGTVLLNNTDVTPIQLNHLIPDIMLAMYNPTWQLFFPSVQDEIAYALENLGLSSEELRSRIDNALTVFCLQSQAKRNPAELSVGIQKMVLMAVMEAIHPKVLLLDEPLSNLSGDNKQLVMNWLNSFCERGGIVIVAEHSQIIEASRHQTMKLPEGRMDI